MPSVIITKIDTVSVDIDGLEYSRPGLVVSFNSGAGTVSVTAGVDTVVSNALYSDIGADGASAFASFAAMQAYFLRNVSALVKVEAENLFQVSINDEQLTRKDLTVSQQSEKLTVEDSGLPVIDDEPAYRIYIAGETEPFADWATLWAWAQANIQYNAVLILPVAANSVEIEEVPYKRSSLTVSFNDQATTVSIGGNADYPNTLYSNIVNANGGIPFTDYGEMKAWVQENVAFLGQTIVKQDDKGYYLINGKPYGKGVLFFAWNDIDESLEIRNSPHDLSEKPMPATGYSSIIADDATEGFETYQELIDYIAENTFVHPTPAP